MTVSRRQLLKYSAALSAASVFGSTGARASALSEYRNLDATAMAELVRRGDASPLKLLDMAIGRFGDEATLFRLAAQLEQARPWFDKIPPI